MGYADMAQMRLGQTRSARLDDVGQYLSECVTADPDDAATISVSTALLD